MARSGSSELRSILASALRLPDVSTPKWVKWALCQFRGDPTQALNKGPDRMWADEVSSARIVILDVGPNRRRLLLHWSRAMARAARSTAGRVVASGNAKRTLAHIE